MARNEFSGVSYGAVVQVGTVHGDVHLPGSESAQQRLQEALRAVTLRIGEGWGVAVAPGLLLTLSALASSAEARLVGGRLALVRTGQTAWACAAVSDPAPDDRLVAEKGPGAPVLDRRTGGVCGVLDGRGDLVLLPEVAELSEAARTNHRWLDLLDAGQLGAGGWNHLPRRLRLYLGAVGKADRDHAYSVISRKAPPLGSIYLSRSVTRQSDREDELPERLPADRLLVEHGGVQVIGIPGTGKSSLARRLVATAARDWLEGRARDFVPVLIPAEALRKVASLPDALADGVMRGLSHQLDRSQLLEMFRVEPLPGVPWLVVVDGVDEVLEPNSRQEVLKKINDFRDDGNRFVITSRPPDRHNFLAKIDQRRFPSYVLEPFNDRQLRDLATRLLEEQGRSQPADAAVRFLARVRDTKLQSLVHVPLIATMLCLLYAEQLDEHLPDNQSQLYARFFDWSVAKLRDLDARASLTEWGAKHGPDAEAAVDRLVTRVGSFLRETAFRRHKLDGRISDLPLIDHAVASSGSVPQGMSEEEWANLVEEVLRISGLVVQRGSDFHFLHQTVEEYLAAGHLASLHDPDSRAGRKWLAPQRQWPWRDLEVRVFLAAQWSDKFDLTKILHRLLKWGRWRHNIGFLAALARHGVPMDAGLVDRAVRILLSVVGNPRSASPEWKDCTTWLRDLDPERAAEVLEKLSANRDADKDRRFEAVRELVAFEVERALPVVEQFVGDTAVTEAPRTAIARQLWESTPEQTVEIFTDLAHSGWQPGIEAAEILCTVLEQGTGPLVQLARGPEFDERTRLGACEALLKHDPDRAVEALSELVHSRPELETLGRAAERLGQADPTLAEVSLTAVVEDDNVPIRYRFTAASHAVRSLHAAPDLLLSLAMSRDIEREWRVESVISVNGHVEARVAVLQDVVDTCAESDSYRLTAFEEMLKIDSGAARAGLSKLVCNPKQGDHSRLRAFELVAKIASAHGLVELGEVFVSQSGVKSSVRLAAARAAVRLHGADAAALYANVAEDDAASPEDRYKAGLALMRYRAMEGARALVELSQSESAPWDLRFQALEKAEGRCPREARGGFVRFAESSRPSDELRLRAAKKIKHEKTAIKVLEELAGRAKNDSFRLEAAQRLVRCDPARGLQALRELIADRRVSTTVKRRAQKEADRLEH